MRCRSVFNQPSFVAFEKLESFLTKSLSGEAHEEEKEYIKMEYSEDIHIESLVHEVDVLKIVIGDETVSCWMIFLSVSLIVRINLL